MKNIPTADYSTMVANLFTTDNVNTDLLGLVHAVAGLVGESGELAFHDGTMENIAEELGDCLFYVTACHQQLSCYVPRRPSIPQRNEKLSSLLHLATDISEVVKKGAFYGKDVWEKIDGRNTVLILLGQYYDQLEFIASTEYNLSISDLQESNYRKLEARYPSGTFTSKDAVARADKN